MEIIAWLCIGSYVSCCIVLLVSWLRIPDFNPKSGYASKTRVSVIIPVRNEAANIPLLIESITNQSFSKKNYEVIFVNDSSTDSTEELIEDYIESSGVRIKLINLAESQDNTSPKKRAITKALEVASGELIVTTDGDCSMGKNWLAAIVGYYEQTHAFFISSPVSFRTTEGSDFISKTWQYCQTIEFASLIGSGAGAIQLGSPNMCSGANIAYRKDVFFEVNGYEGNEHLASGDDEFLMQKVANKYPEKVHYLKSKEAIVETLPHDNLFSFFQQRKRWASKWRFYKNWQPTALAIYIAVVNAITIWAFFNGRIDLILLKFSVEFVFLSVIVLFLDKDKTVPFIPLTQLLYPFYVLIIAVAVQGKGVYHWKGRKLK